MDELPKPIIIPDDFKEKYLDLVDDKSSFLESLSTPLRRSFRVNTLRGNRDLLIGSFKRYGLEIKQTPWCPDAFSSDSGEIGYTLENFMGYIYIQELASMIPPLSVKDELEKAEFVLDGCAAPGSKTSQIAAIMKNKGIIVANDISYQRIGALKSNLEKTGATNTVITNTDFRFFPNIDDNLFKEGFDVVFVDAPCSADGTVRKKPRIFQKWKKEDTFGYVDLQYQLIKRGYELTKKGGVLVYSTCSMSPAEDEQVVDWLLKRYPDAVIEKINIDGLKITDGLLSWNGKIYDPRVKNAARIWPHHNDTDGFFICRIRKV